MADKQTPRNLSSQDWRYPCYCHLQTVLSMRTASFKTLVKRRLNRYSKQVFKLFPPRISVNCYVVQSAGKIAVIIDTGSGDTMGPTLLGQMPSLELINIKPKDVDSVLLTHMHPDHSKRVTRY